MIAVNPSAVLPGAVCSASGRGKRVTVNYADGQKTGSIDIESAGQHSSIRSNTDDLTRTDDHHLAYGSNDVFITSIVLDGQPLCTFTDKSQLAALVILDYPK